MTISRLWTTFGRRLALATALSAIAGCHSGSGGPLALQFGNDGNASAAVVRVTGLSSDELRELARVDAGAPVWASLLRVNIAGNDTSPVAGKYSVREGVLEFRPAFPFDAGRTYTARLDPGQLPVPRAEGRLEASLSVPAVQRTPSTSVVGLSPTAEMWPENMLRFYIEFSAPMSRTGGIQFVHLLDEKGEEVPDALLAAYSDLWNPDRTRLTVFFDPGRVKRGVGPNVALGRALVSGRRYAIHVDAAWRDAQGQPLVASFRREFVAGDPQYQAVSVGDWHLVAPHAGTRDALVVSFPWPLDRALLTRTVGVATGNGRPLAGEIDVLSGETRWQFIPASPWTAEAYHLVVLTLLEDPAGNKVGRPFEVKMLDTPEPTTIAEPESVSLAFQIQ